MLSYCTSLGTHRGGLIYPKSELGLDMVDETLILSSPIAIRRFALTFPSTPAPCLPK